MYGLHYIYSADSICQNYSSLRSSKYLPIANGALGTRIEQSMKKKKAKPLSLKKKHNRKQQNCNKNDATKQDTY